MSDELSIWLKLKSLRDELKLQVHLMSMELEDEWQQLEHKFSRMNSKFERTLMEKAQHLGEHREQFFVGDEEELELLLKDFDNLKRRNQQ
ncbi:hypothetical protein OE749_09635 [Aestuariibacter sp. AA17]|uniref:Uncharacterized protein n=1 Tax=Fluctibacter corallii TaxID=2984329 RepID=A0ABT3A8P0_9ALTE|nr:hypothetical protein [Aestuariibacter sp. AA17]MCV2884957.1 hypothetical protein [Aestuariibacter sp. AA17]